jgi:NAD(P)-dependent dehydrogenase (short-subunit alcohol dehydrogenase family)
MTTTTTAVSTQREPELLGQTVVVIGGSAGIGLETARRARAEGATGSAGRLADAAQLRKEAPYKTHCFRAGWMTARAVCSPQTVGKCAGESPTAFDLVKREGTSV